MKLTPWFVNGEKPARPGVYNVSCRKTDQSGIWYAYWNGKFWVHGFYSAISYAYDHRHCEHPSFLLSRGDGSWRGLAEEPTA